MSDDMDIDATAVADERPSPPASPDGNDDADELPVATLEAMKLAVAKAPDGDEITGMLKTLLTDYLTRVPFLQQQIEDQQATIAELQRKSELEKALVNIDRNRFVSERASWQAQTDALIRTREAEAAAGSRPKGILDLDVNYHRDLEAANKRLEMDNRLMAPRLVDTQQQIEKLVNELRVLRTHVILQTGPFTEEEGKDYDEATAGTSTAVQRTPAQPKPKHMSKTVMGDARAEHLLLAAKKVRSMRQQDKNVGLLTLEELQRKGVVGPDGGLSYSEGYGGLPEEDELLPSEDEDRKPSTSTATPAYHRASSTAKSTGTPLLPRPKKAKRNAPTTPSRARTNQQAPQTTPGGSNFNDLLLAAEMATRPPTPSRSVPNNMSSARTTTSLWEATAMQSPTKKPRRQPPATVEWSTRRHVSKEGDGSPNRGDGGSALDLLAQASQDVAQGSSGGGLASAARLGGAMEGDSSRQGYRAQGTRSETPLGPAINLDSRGTPSHFPPGPDNPFVGSPNAFQSPTGAAVPGLGKYVHLSSTVPARRVRSPYLKWTKEEDELLTRAVMEHGEKWDLVSKCVPTRSYHQVRQRWLRKTGAFDKKPATTDPSPLSAGVAGEQSSPTPRGRKRKE
ncbi:uncharacterized protein CcaverHIS019_0302380 [Cutaneotrichosporon cavernicola]|uniref:Myb-like domain-containing protein n=1 Tax=Cutaneotrichosporon cavernicola TaxID=279322 RepID=A0AA48IIW0_9TREE|nr:uncharacterized protein CcaverHIS019_0302380 [Cutaneotrichosporon cavernicola]BEI90168.1 hypothetical protein CcaverHIS019_0302380 [Cutaneotrichosporon cavernicola]BEI97946.1 hypothetical protein CcaverHIS631_0302450 [Cutaneotrichosporon cavernicola]